MNKPVSVDVKIPEPTPVSFTSLFVCVLKYEGGGCGGPYILIGIRGQELYNPNY